MTVVGLCEKDYDLAIMILRTIDAFSIKGQSDNPVLQKLNGKFYNFSSRRSGGLKFTFRL